MSDSEKFNFKKAIKALNIADPISWMKSLSVGLRLAILVGLVALGVYGWGYWRGAKSRPVQVDWADGTKIVLVNGDGKEHLLEKRGGKLYFDGRTVRVGDIPSLKPYGVGLHPKLIAGATSSGSPAVGLGLEVAHAYNFNLEALALYKFLGIGVSYDVRLEKPIIIDNTSIGIGIGRDFESSENAIIAYVGIEF